MAVYIKKNGQIVRLDGNKLGNSVKDTTSTTFNAQSINSLNSYIFTQPLSSLTISSFADTTSDLLKEYRISFKASANFMFTWNVSGKTFRFAEGETIWNTTEIYTLVICEGIDTDYLIYVVRG